MTHRFLPFLSILSLVACCIEVDISVPSFPSMVAHFHASPSLIQLTVAVNFLGFFLSSFFYGPLSDLYGRRPIMIIGNSIMCLGAVGCIVSPTVSWLLISRFIQGIGASTSMVVVFAMIADVYKGEKAVRLMGFLNASLTVFVALAPIAGSFLNQFVGWRGSYTTVAAVCGLAVVCLILLLKETKPTRDVPSFKTIGHNYKTLLGSSRFIVASLIPSLLCAAYMAFVACASFLYMETYHLTITEYAIHQGLIVGAFSVLSLFGDRVAKRVGAARGMIASAVISVVSTGVFLVASWGWAPSVYLVTTMMILFAGGAALVFLLVFVDSLEIFPSLKGTASSAIMGMRAFVCALGSGLMSAIYNGDPFRVAVLVFAFNLLVGGLLILFLRRKNGS